MIRRMDSKYWQNKNVFVTGATGFLGSWLVKHLVDSGANVAALVRDVVHHSNLYRSGYANKISLVYGELENYLLLERAFGEYETEAVFHAGAQTIVEIANRNPLSTFETNIRGTVNVLEASRRTPTIKKVIVASSDKAYGSHATLPYDESFPLRGEYPYDVSKSCTDLLAQSYGKSYGMNIGISRSSNVYGGGDLNFDRIVPETIKHILFDEPILIRSNGKFVREFFYVEDAVLAYLTLAEKISELDLKGEAFNFGTDQPITILDLVKKIKDISGKENAEIKILDVAKTEIKDQFLSSKKAQNILGWSPSHDLNSGLSETYLWYKEFFNK